MKINVGKMLVDSSTSYEAVKSCFEEIVTIGNTLTKAIETQNWGEVGRATEKLDVVYKILRALQDKLKPHTLS